MIGEKTFAAMKKLADELIHMHGARMAKAFNLQTDGKLAVAITFSIQPSAKADIIEVDAVITYVMEKVKEKITANVSEKQEELKLYPLRRPEEA